MSEPHLAVSVRMAGALRKAGEAAAKLRRLGAAVSEPQRGRPRRKAFLRASWPFGSFRPAKRTQLAPLAIWPFSVCEKNRCPAVEACSGSMLFIAGRRVFGR